MSTILNFHFSVHNKYIRIHAKAMIPIIDYSPLWETMKRKNITQYKLLQSDIDNKTLDALKKNKNITLLTVERLCEILDCTPNDIVQFPKNKNL